MMICNTTSHFDYQRILFLILGLWPYQQSKLVQLQLTLIFGILVSFIVAQLAVFSSVECTMNIGIKVLSVALFIIVFTVKYSYFRINIQIVKGSLEDLQHICNKLQDKNEIAIIEKYGNSAKRITAISIYFLLFNAIGLLLLSIFSHVPGIIFIDNGLLHRSFLNVAPVYYFNKEKYFYLFLLHINVVAQVGGTTLIATGTMLLTYFRHVCGLFKIASYRIEKVLMTNMMQNDSLKKEIVNYKEIILAVDIHRKAVKFCQFVIFNFQGMHFILTMVSVICLSFNLYQITEIISFGKNFEQLVIHFIITGSVFVYFFVGNYAGQEITDYHNQIFSTVYNLRWYVAPLHIQKMILFLLQRGSKTLVLHMGGMYTANLEFFATLTKVSISYFTIICSIQK